MRICTHNKHTHVISIGKRPMFAPYRAAIDRKEWAKAGAYVQDEEGGDQARSDADIYMGSQLSITTMDATNQSTN